MKKALTLASLAALAAGVITTAAVAATSDTGANAEATLRLADGTDIGTADFRDARWRDRGPRVTSGARRRDCG